MRRLSDAITAIALVAAGQASIAASAHAQAGCSRPLTNQGTIQPTTVTLNVSGSVTSTQGHSYAVTVNQAGTYTFTFCPPGTTNYDPYLCLYDSAFTLITSSDDSCGLQSHIVRSLTPGTYHIGVSGFGSSAGAYTLAYFANVTNGPFSSPVVGNAAPASGSWVGTSTPTLSATVIASSGATTVHAEFSIDGGPFTDGSVVTGSGASSFVPPALPDGAHTWQVRAHDDAGLFSAALSLTLNVDASPPAAGTVNDGTAADVDWQSSTSTIAANWTAFADPQSTVTYAWAIGTTPGGTNIQTYVTVGSVTSATNTGLSLTSNGPYFVTVRATNLAGLQTFATSDGVTVLTNATAAALADATVGQPYSGALTASFGTGPYAWTLESGTLAPGLTPAADGTISGTPTAAGTYVFGVSAQDSLAVIRRFAYRILVVPSGGGLVVSSGNPTTPTSIPSARLFFSYTHTLTATGGQTPYVWRVASGSLPAGLILDSLTGVISGFVSSRVGTFTFTVAAADVNDPSQESTAILTISVAGTAPFLSITTTAALPAANTNGPYAVILAQNGGTAPYTWSVSVGTLPVGLTLDSTGILSGTPTSAGPSSFTLTVTDAASATANLAATLSVGTGTGPLLIDPSILPLATQGTAYPVTFTASGGTAGYAWSITSGSLPPGLTLDPATGTLTGSPSASGPYRFIVRAVDSGATVSTASVLREINVLRTASGGYVIVTPSPLPSASVGAVYSTPMTVVGGTSPHAWSLFSGSLPPGLALNANTGEISGTPTAGGTFAFAIEASSSGAILSSVRLYAMFVAGAIAGGGGGGGGCGLTGAEPVALLLMALGRRRRRLSAGR